MPSKEYFKNLRFWALIAQRINMEIFHVIRYIIEILKYKRHNYLVMPKGTFLYRTFLYAALAAIGFVSVTSGPALAACATPVGEKPEGSIIYNIDHKTPQYCDGTQWIGMDTKVQDTVNQLSCETGETIKYDGEAWNCAEDGAGEGDNLGDHTATQDIDLGASSLVGNGGTNGISITSNGHVGVGTVNPQQTLHVAGDVRSDGSIWLDMNGNGNFGIITEAGKDGIGLASNYERLADPELYVAVTGNVGIGTTEPKTELHVIAPETDGVNGVTAEVPANGTGGTRSVLRSAGGIVLIRPSDVADAPDVNGFVDFSAFPNAYPTGRYARLSWYDAGGIFNFHAYNADGSPAPAGMTISGDLITGGTATVATPTQEGHAATKAYVDARLPVCPVGAQLISAGGGVYECGPLVPDPCKTGSVGTACRDGAVYAGTSNGNRIYAAPADEGGVAPFWNNGSSGWTRTNASSLSDGLINTNTLVSLSDAGAPYKAAEACRSRGAAWYLPALDELNLLYQNRSAIGGFSLGGSWYWSSSEVNDYYVWIQGFSNGSQSSAELKYEINQVRCVRR